MDLIWRSPSGTQCGQDKTHGLSEHACSLHTPNPSTQSTPGLTTVDTMVYHYSHTRLPTLPPPVGPPPAGLTRLWHTLGALHAGVEHLLG